MKIMNNSDKFPHMSNENLLEELRNLDTSLKLTEELGTGSDGVKSIIIAAEQELESRGVASENIRSRQL